MSRIFSNDEICMEAKDRPAGAGGCGRSTLRAAATSRTANTRPSTISAARRAGWCASFRATLDRSSSDCPMSGAGLSCRQPPAIAGLERDADEVQRPCRSRAVMRMLRRTDTLPVKPEVQIPPTAVYATIDGIIDYVVIGRTRRRLNFLSPTFGLIRLS